MKTPPWTMLMMMLAGRLTRHQQIMINQEEFDDLSPL